MVRHTRSHRLLLLFGVLVAALVGVWFVMDSVPEPAVFETRTASASAVLDPSAAADLEERTGTRVAAVYTEPSTGSSDVLVMSEDGDARIELLGVRSHESIDTIAFIPHERERRLASDVAVVTGAEVEEAFIRLRVYEPVKAIGRCDEYDATTGCASGWVPTTIPFVERNGFVEFTVPHFTGYGAIPKSELFYATSTASSSDATANIALASTRDGTVNQAAWTMTSGTLYTMMNATLTNTETRIIRTNDAINFSSYWSNGNRIDEAYATFKLFIGETLVCQSGNDNTGGTLIPDNGAGLRTGSCFPATNITAPAGQQWSYVINVWAQTIGGGGPASTRTAILQWDTVTADTWVRINSANYVDITLSLNQSTARPGQNIRANGTLFYFNGTNANGRTVTVSFINTTGSTVQETNVTTNATGEYNETYAIPASATPGLWTVNVTGYHNATVYGINSSTFTVTYFIDATNPVNETTIDRDETNATISDFTLLEATTSGSVSDGTIVDFFGNLTNPAIIGQNDISLGSTTTNSNIATLFFNPANTLYAGNYTWLANNSGGETRDTRTFLLYGQLDTQFSNVSAYPSANHNNNETVEVRLNLTSQGPEDETTLASSYGSNASAQFTAPSGANITRTMSFTGPYWNASLNPADMNEVGTWNVSLDASSTWFFSNTTGVRTFDVYGYMRITENSTTPTTLTVYQNPTTTCRVQDESTNAPVIGANVTFLVNSSPVGNALTNSSGHATLSYQVTTVGATTITCRVSNQTNIYYNAGSPNEHNTTITVEPFPVTMTAPVNGTIIDRDGVNATDPDSTTLTATVPGYIPDGITIQFRANLTTPGITPTQENILIGSNTTSTGQVVTYWNPNNTIYAGNWTIYATATNGYTNSTRNTIVKGAYSITYADATNNPNNAYNQTDSASIVTNITSYGPENRSAMNESYFFAVDNTILNTTNNTSTTSLFFNGTTWNGAQNLNALLGVGTWTSRTNASSNYWYTNETNRTFTLYGFMNVTSNLTTPSSAPPSTELTTTCSVQDQLSGYPLASANVTFYRNGTLIGSNLTNINGEALLSHTIAISGTWTITCNVTAQPAILYYRGLEPERNSTVTIDPGANLPPVLVGVIEDASNSTNPTNEGQNITFTANATDPETDDYYLIICNNLGISGGNCDDTEICRSTTVTSGTTTSCQHNTSGETGFLQPWVGYVCDINFECSLPENSTAPYAVNHAPSVSVSLTPATPTINDVLTCSPLFSDDDPGDTPTGTYQWWIQNESTGAYDTISGETGSTLTYPSFDSNDRINCEVTPTDSFGFEGLSSNSSIVAITNGTLASTFTAIPATMTVNVSKTVTVQCSVTNGESTTVNATLQDNSSGTWQQTTTTPGTIYANESFRTIGAVINGTASFNVNITAQASGNYTFRAVCAASDTTPSSATSTTTTIEATVSMSLPPVLVGVIEDASNSTNPTNEGQNITFTTNATDPETDDYYLIICNNPGISGGNCDDTEICRSTTVTSGTTTSCQHNTSGESAEAYSWIGYVCDEFSSCSTGENSTAPYYVNHAPITNPVLTPSPANVSDILTCTPNSTDDDSGDTISNTYRWFMQDENVGAFDIISGQTTNQLTNTFFDSNDAVLCEVTPTDNHGFVGTTVNSSSINITQGAMTATAVLGSSTIDRWYTTTLNATCSVSGGDAESVTLVIQDNSGGGFAQSSTTPLTSTVWVNQATFALGRLASTSSTVSVTVFGNTTGVYQFRTQCQASDATPPIANSTGQTLTVSTDATAPIISDNSVSPTGSSATVTWTTDDYATSTVDYGETTALGSTVVNPSYVRSHSVSLTGLTANTLYYYNITSCNVDELCSQIGLFNFTTSGPQEAFPFEKGYCTGRYLERGPNPENGYIVPGDVFEYWCETPYSIGPNNEFAIRLITGNQELRRTFTTPRITRSPETAIYP